MKKWGYIRVFRGAEGSAKFFWSLKHQTFCDFLVWGGLDLQGPQLKVVVRDLSLIPLWGGGHWVFIQNTVTNIIWRWLFQILIRLTFSDMLSFHGAFLDVVFPWFHPRSCIHLRKVSMATIRISWMNLNDYLREANFQECALVNDFRALSRFLIVAHHQNG